LKVKTRLVEGKTINLREIEEDDAEFVVRLRTDADLSRHLSPIEDNIEEQKAYIRGYKEKENEWYMVIESKDGERYGLGRIYDVTEESFVPGSWIIKKDAPRHTGIESIVTLYEYTFVKLGLKRADIRVRIDNTKIIAFHERFGAIRSGENEKDVCLVLTREAYERTRMKYKKYLGGA
jgi:RimJ/RimL family protein N-acetyltransferase